MKKNSTNRSLVFTYIYLAASCFAIGVGIVFLTLAVCKRLGVDIFTHLWVLAIPVILTLVINVGIVELYHKITGK